MGFKVNQVLHLPQLAARVGLASGEFRVDLIVSGGMGECIRIVQGNESFALKIVQRRLVEDHISWSRYLREVRLWTTLSACGGIVEAFCIISINGIPVVCSRWMSGGNLRTHLANRSPEFFFSVMSRIVGTLAWTLETHQTIHRDLKPDNILLDGAGLAFVSDWGIARSLTAPDSSASDPGLVIRGTARPALTAAGSFLGTVYYASPEQLMGEALDHRTDIYSLGCLMYEWETGACPFTGTTPEEIQLKHLLEAPPQLGSFLKKTAFRAEGVIRSCLEKDPRKRPINYASLDLALAEAAKRRGVRYQSFKPSLRYEMPMVGAGEFQERNRDVRRSPTGYAVVEYSEIEPFLREADALTAVGDCCKAAEIYGNLFVPDLVTAVPDDSGFQQTAINYAFCLNELGRYDDAIKTLASLSSAKQKPAEYFINLTLAHIRLHDYQSAMNTVSVGLQQYPDDQDLLGNLLVVQTRLGTLADAAETAKTRLRNRRDIHSLQEVATLHCKYADSMHNLDWPLAVQNWKYAVGLLSEAKDLNPRFLPARFQLARTLESMTAYVQCVAETKAVHDTELPMHFSDRVFLAYLHARCLDRVSAHKECWRFCDGWIKGISDAQAASPVPRHAIISLERVRAETIVDGFCIGMMNDGQRVFSSVAAEFFAHIVHDEKMREPGDFCYLARLHEWAEEYEQAYSVLDDAEVLYPQYWEIPFQRAAFCVRAEVYSNALSSAERSTDLAPWKTQTWELMSEIFRSLGKVTQAQIATDRAKEIQRVREELAQEISAA
jgi:serine/threonine protein kinase